MPGNGKAASVFDVCRELLTSAYPQDASALSGEVIGYFAEIAQDPAKVDSRKGAQRELEQLEWLMALERGRISKKDR
jgi:hypothetical protein